MDRSDVIIIGGGIAGTSTAFHLAEHGRSVTLLERGSIASEASGVNAGGVGALGWGHRPDLESYLTMGSLQIFKRMQIEMGYDIEFRASGGLQAVQTDGQFEYARDRVLRLKSLGYSLELLSVNEARAIEPELSPALKAAIYFPMRGQADPVKTTRAFADGARHLGASILEDREVTSITMGADGDYRVGCRDEEFRAGNLVLAAGAWCRSLGDLLRVSIPIVPVRGQMWATEPLPPRVFHGMSGAESYAHWSADPGAGPDSPPELTHTGDRRVTRHLYGRQTRDGEVIFGGDRQLAGYDRTVASTGVEANFAHACRDSPVLEGSGHRPHLVGPHALLPRWQTNHWSDTATEKPVHRFRVGVIGVRTRAHGRQAACGLPAYRTPAAGPGGIRPGQMRVGAVTTRPLAADALTWSHGAESPAQLLQLP